MQTPKPGEILLGKYRVEEIIGVGGMGRVVKASHLYLQQPVAIKILLPEMAGSQTTIARFLREAQATVRLRSEHIARVMDVGTMPDGCPFIVMEYLEGHDLNQILRHHGPQPAQAVVDLVLQACEGMAEAHAMGIVHRDIKPSNFFITRRPDGSNLLKILDFGISKTPAELTELTGTQTVIGTPTYMAPEQMVSARSTDPRSDVWSIGVVTYQMLEGRPPFEAETYAELVLKVGGGAPAPMHVALPPGLADVVMRCLERDPARRIQSVGELARSLAPYASDPIAAQQAAERAARTLSGRAPQHGLSMSGATPPPRTWGNDGSSLSGSAGQLGTRKVRTTSRAYVIAGVAALCVLAGVGGFFVASSLKDEHPTAASEDVGAEVEHKTLPAARPAEAIADAGVTAAAPVDAGVAAKVVEKATAEKTSEKKTEKKTVEKKTVEKKTVEKKTVEKKTATTKPTRSTKPAGDDDLFDDRK